MLRVLIVLGVALIAGCDKPPGNVSSTVEATDTAERRTYEVKGVIIELRPEEKEVEIQHEEIPGYMRAMTMPFEVRDLNELAGLEPGDSVSFRMIVTGTEGWIEQIRKRGPGKAVIPTGGRVRLVRDVDPLEIGDPLPEYRFTNQFGRLISTSQFQGQALAITFIFTRCPYPTFCPRMMNQFTDAQQVLKSMPNAPTNWHLLTLSFDPEFDKPAILKAYGERHKYDSNHWTIATGELIDVTAIAEQFGLQFWHEEAAGISHNLRTAVIDSSGRVQRIFPGNKWVAEELVDEMIKAAAP
jgi:protein SCO1